MRTAQNRKGWCAEEKIYTQRCSGGGKTVNYDNDDDDDSVIVRPYYREFSFERHVYKYLNQTTRDWFIHTRLKVLFN